MIQLRFRSVDVDYEFEDMAALETWLNITEIEWEINDGVLTFNYGDGRGWVGVAHVIETEG